MYLKLGRLYLGLEKTPQGVKALKKVGEAPPPPRLGWAASFRSAPRLIRPFPSCFQALSIMEVAHGKDHDYVAEVKREIEEQE